MLEEALPARAGAGAPVGMSNFSKMTWRRERATRALCVLTLVGVAAIGSPVAASGLDDGASLTITSAGSASIPVQLTSTTRWGYDDIPPTMRGSFAVLIVEQARMHRVVEVRMRAKALDSDVGNATLYPLVVTSPLPPGRYVFVLLSDGPLTMHVDVGGLRRPLFLRPRRTVTAAAAQAGGAAASPAPVSQFDRMLHLRRSSFGVSVVYQLQDPDAAQSLTTCLVRNEGTCPMSDVHTLVTATDCPGLQGVGCGHGLLAWAMYQPGTLTPGDYHAVATTAGAGVTERAGLFAAAASWQQ